MVYKRLKQVGKIAGKTLATVVCPPFGGALWGKNLAERLKGAYFGMVGSAIFSIASIPFLATCGSREYYDNPSLYTGLTPSSMISPLILGLTSPGAFILDHSYKTDLCKSGEDGKQSNPNFKCFVKGKDVIQFNNGRYSLNFPIEKEFRIANGDWQSVQQAQAELDGYREREDVLNARNAKTRFEKIRENYNDLRGRLQSAVDNMNLELGQLGQTEQERGKK